MHSENVVYLRTRQEEESQKEYVVLFRHAESTVSFKVMGAGCVGRDRQLVADALLAASLKIRGGA